MKLIALLPIVALSTVMSAQTMSDTARHEAFIKGVYDRALENQTSYHWLEELCKDVGPRLAGSEGANKAVLWAKATLDTLGFDTVYLQEVSVPHWERGAESCVFTGTNESLTICGLGGTAPTAREGLTAEVIEIPDVDDLENYTREQIQGKIVFFSAPMRQSFISTGSAYGEAVKKRYIGAVEASQYGAMGVLIRSVTTKKDDAPHTGSMTYSGAYRNIPAAALGYQSADRLQRALRENPHTKVTLKLENTTYDNSVSYNVIAEVKGTVFPNEIAIAGGHLDSWDLAEGAQDDGAGAVQSMEAIYLLMQSGYEFKRTHRVVLFMNEEFGLQGARTYAALADSLNEDHLIGIESDGGGDVPRGFGIQSLPSGMDAVKNLRWFLEPYGLYEYSTGWSGADVGQLHNDYNILLGYRADNQRYFDYHHAPTDVFETINARALELGSASMASMLYLLDQYEVKP